MAPLKGPCGSGKLTFVRFSDLPDYVEVHQAFLSEIWVLRVKSDQTALFLPCLLWLSRDYLEDISALGEVQPASVGTSQLQCQCPSFNPYLLSNFERPPFYRASYSCYVPYVRRTFRKFGSGGCHPMQLGLFGV